MPPRSSGRHAEYFGALGGERRLARSDRPSGPSNSAPEEETCDRAIRWYLVNDIAPLPHIFRILWLFWQLRDRMPEGHDWLDELLDRADELDDPSQAQLLLMAAVTEGEVGNHDAALSVSAAWKRCKDASTIPISRLHRSSCSRGPDRSTETSRARCTRPRLAALEGFRRQDELGVDGSRRSSRRRRC